MKQSLSRERYARFVSRHPQWVMVVALALTALSITVALLWLSKEKSTTALYDPDSPEQVRYRQYVDEFGEPDDLILVVEGGEATERRQLVKRMAGALEGMPRSDIAQVVFQVPVWSFATLLHASPDDLRSFQETLGQSDSLLNQVLEARTLEDLLARLAKSLEAGLKSEQRRDDPQFFFQRASLLAEALLTELQSESPVNGAILFRWARFFFEQFEGTDEEGFLTADQGALHLIFVKPADLSADTEKASRLVAQVRSMIALWQSEFPDLHVGLTGEPALVHDEFQASERDMILATLFALFTTALIFFLAFASFARPVFGFLCLIMGVAITFGFITVTVGHLSLLSLTFAVILIGLGTQYGIHIIARYEEERGRDVSVEDTLRILLNNTVPSLLIGALTTAAAFYSTLWIDFRGFQELGFIAGSGVLICFILMSFVLPAFLVWHDRLFGKLKKKRALFSPQLRGRFSQFYLRGMLRVPGIFLIASFLVVALALYGYFGIPREHFDYNLLNLQADGTEAVAFERRLIETDVSPRFAVYMAKSKEEARAIAEKTAAQEAIGKVQTFFDIVPDLSPEKLTLVKQIARTLDRKFTLGNRPSQPAQFDQSLKRLQVLFAEIEEKLFSGGYIAALEHAGSVSESLMTMRDYLASLDPDEATRRLNLFQETFSTQLRRFFQAESERETFSVRLLPRALKGRFLSERGTYAVYAYPADDIWSREGLHQYVTALRRVSPEFTGPPLQMFEVLNSMDKGWYRAALSASIVIFLLFLIDFRRLSWALIATVPLGVGVAWIYGGMALINMKWNIVNLIALPLVLGIGADCGIHLIHRYRERAEGDLSFVLSSTGKAVSIAYADTLTSFLGLAVASHRGLGSLGKVIIWGIFCCYIAGMIVLPALLSLWHRRMPKSI